MFGQPWPPKFVRYGTYSPPVHRAWKDAWRITEHAILDLFDETNNRNAQLILLLLTSDVQIVPDPVDYVTRLSGVRPPSAFDPAYPNRRISEFAAKLGIPCLDMLPLLVEYRDTHELDYPYFWYGQDRHWNALAHEIAANSLADFIRSHRALS